MATKQILLSAKGCSGRGVRVKTLSPSERLKLLEDTAKNLGADATLIELRTQESLSGVASIVVGVTEKSGLKTKDDLAAAVWKPVSRKDLEDSLDTFFNAPDQDALFQIFRKLHTVGEAEVDTMLGEALDVAEG